MGWEMPWYSARDSLSALLVGRQVDMMHLVCYLRDGDRVFETHWTTRRDVEEMDDSLALMDLTVYGRQEPWADSPPGWPQEWQVDGSNTRTGEHPAVQCRTLGRLSAGGRDERRRAQGRPPRCCTLPPPSPTPGMNHRPARWNAEEILAHVCLVNAATIAAASCVAAGANTTYDNRMALNAWTIARVSALAGGGAGSASASACRETPSCALGGPAPSAAELSTPVSPLGSRGHRSRAGGDGPGVGWSVWPRRG